MAETARDERIQYSDDQPVKPKRQRTPKSYLKQVISGTTEDHEHEPVEETKPKRRNLRAEDRIKRETEAKLRAGLTELQPYSMMVMGPLGLTNDEVDDLSRVGGKLAARHASVAKLIDAGDEASVYIDATIVAGKMYFRRHALLTYGIDITTPEGLAAYVAAVRSGQGAAETTTEPETPDETYVMGNGAYTSPAV